MPGTQLEHLVIVVIFSSLMLLTGLYFLAKFHSFLRKYVRLEWLRKNLVVWFVAICFTFAITPTNPEFFEYFSKGQNLAKFFLIQFIAITCMVFFVFNVTWYVASRAWILKRSMRVKMGLTLLTMIITTIGIGIIINYWGNHGSFKNVEISIIYNFYTATVAGLIYIATSYVDLDRKRKMNEKELEVSRLRELKTKAELDALHSKINPHFLYNALNSIADLSVTDGKKARKMTVALADLFRYSINYSDNNYSTVRQELEMAEVYLQIEKIRFEDQLSYSIDVGKELDHYLIPRFVLQPIVENAVKHGLKATGRMTEITIEVKPAGTGLELIVADNGPAFPDELSPGYGVKSMYDKLDLLFPNAYEVHFSNQPRKNVSIQIHKLMKNEPTVV